jgi:hypothetical protein
MRTRAEYQTKAELYRLMANRVGGDLAQYWLRLAAEYDLIARGIRPMPLEERSNNED